MFSTSLKKFTIYSILTATSLIAFTLIVPNSKIAFGYGGGGSGSAGTAPVCGDSKPSSAPTLLSATPTGNNSIILRWSKASDPASYYLVTFGLRTGEQLYGNPNVGGNDTTAYTINNLSGGTRYFFKVRAGNGCMPGDYSNEVSAVAGGVQLASVPSGFEAGVLGSEIETTPSPTTTGSITPTAASTPEVINISENEQNGGFFAGLWRFFANLLGFK